ncbi:hypothetical protein [Nocardia sp. NRRL S-836]|uniref:hypothetical protein n=1 Tax=Nocardia sp. NRRL S-836 TaxID=1519492 RepID=UPI0006B036C0|nr:hypothetical protein [Nocardia sp. NRRL S-836]KOV84760.1 hypothetical protein ADL03_15970 [Nocardia sp. NRRL S-836]
MAEGKVEVHTGRPSWHQEQAGAISAGITSFDTPEQAHAYLDGFRAHHPGKTAFVIDRRPKDATADTAATELKGEAS